MKRLSIDYVSDLHLAFYLKASKNDGFRNEDIKEFIKNTIVPKIKGEILIIAGDLSEYINSNIFFLNECANHYDKVLYIAGNHEYYLSWIIGMEMKKQYKESTNKILDIISSLEGNDKVIFLDRNEPLYHGLYNYNDFSIAGDTLWYYPKTIRDWYFYLANSNDSRLIISKTDNIITKIKHLNKASITWYDSLPYYVDIIATHVPPLYNPQSSKAKNGCYFTPVDIIKTDTWIYGHDHVKSSFQKNGCRFLSNPWGYHSTTFEIENIEITK